MQRRNLIIKKISTFIETPQRRANNLRKHFIRQNAAIVRGLGKLRSNLHQV